MKLEDFGLVHPMFDLMTVIYVGFEVSVPDNIVLGEN